MTWTLPSLGKALLYGKGIAALRADDLFLSSYPRSGSTWFRMVYCNLIVLEQSDDEQMSFDKLNRMMPELGVSDLSEAWPYRDFPRLVKTHQPFRIVFGRRGAIGVLRDPRDVMVSFYHFRKDRKHAFDGTFQEFLREARFGLEAWCRHYVSWQRRWTVVMRYEAAQKDAAAEIGRVLAAAGVTRLARLDEALERSAVGRMRQLESNTAGHATFARKAEVGQWQNYFNDEDMDYFNRAMRRHGVEVSW